MRIPSAIIGATTILACATSTGRSSAAKLDDRTWNLVQIEGRSVVAGGTARAPFVVFAADSNRVSGNASCNRFSGPYTRNGERLEFGALLSTKMACADNLLNQQESQFMAALSRTKSHRVSGDTLWLEDAASKSLATLVAATP